MRRRTAIGIAAACTAVVVAAGAAVWLLSRPDGLEDAARSYLAALAAGDYQAIESMYAAPPESAATIEDAFTGAAEYITEPEITSASESDGTVLAAARLGGAEVEVAFTLVEDDSGWRLPGDRLGSVTVDSPWGDAAWIGGALVPLDSAIPLLPAAYEVAPAPRDILDGTQTVPVTGAQPVEVALEPVLADEAVALAQAQVDAYADACAEPATTVPERCGLRIPWAADLTELEMLAFRVERHPEVSLSPDTGAFAATGGVIVATATGTARSGGVSSFTYRADDWTLRGGLAFTGDEMLLSVR